MTVSRPQSGALCRILPHGVKMVIRKVENQSKTTQGALVNDLKAVRTTVTKNTTGNTLCCNGLKPCSAHQVTLLKTAHAQACLKFASEYLK